MANLRNFDLNLLLVLDGVLREGTLSNAATALKVGQPTTSSSLAKLREILQDELFVRSENGMQPTPRALALKEPVQRVLTAVKGEILDTGRFDPATEIRPYTVATPDIGEKVLLPRVVARASDEGEREHKPETPGAGANNDVVHAILDRYGCAVPLHAVRTRFLGKSPLRSRQHRPSTL